MKFFGLLLVVSSLLFSANKEVAVVKHCTGDVYVKHEGLEEVAHIGDMVGPHDELISRDDNKVQYMLSKGRLFGPDPKGTLMIKRAAKQEVLYLGDIIYENDIIITKKASSVGLLFKDDSVLSLGSESMIVVDKYIYQPKKDEYNFTLNFKQGTAVYESGTIGKKDPNAFKFNVPEGTIAIRGTKFCVKVEK
jgi:hypothetical protein